jgi:hypothetical protein
MYCLLFCLQFRWSLGMQQRLRCHLATVVETECRRTVPESQSRELEMVLANGTLEIRSDRIMKKILPFLPAASGDITFLRATKFHIALEKGPYLINVGPLTLHEVAACRPN